MIFAGKISVTLQTQSHVLAGTNNDISLGIKIDGTWYDMGELDDSNGDRFEVGNTDTFNLSHDQITSSHGRASCAKLSITGNDIYLMDWIKVSVNGHISTIYNKNREWLSNNPREGYPSMTFCEDGK